MSSRNGDDSDAIMFILVVIALVIAFGIWKFSTALSVDFASGAKCIGIIVGVTGLLFTFFKVGFEVNRWIWSGAMSLYSLALIPILDKWASNAVPEFMQNAAPIYGTWYFQTGMFLSPLLTCWIYTEFFDK